MAGPAAILHKLLAKACLNERILPKPWFDAVNVCVRARYGGGKAVLLIFRSDGVAPNTHTSGLIMYNPPQGHDFDPQVHIPFQHLDYLSSNAIRDFVHNAVVQGHTSDLRPGESIDPWVWDKSDAWVFMAAMDARLPANIEAIIEDNEALPLKRKPRERRMDVCAPGRKGRRFATKWKGPAGRRIIAGYVQVNSGKTTIELLPEDRKSKWLSKVPIRATLTEDGWKVERDSEHSPERFIKPVFDRVPDLITWKTRFDAAGELPDRLWAAAE